MERVVENRDECTEQKTI